MMSNAAYSSITCSKGLEIQQLASLNFALTILRTTVSQKLEESTFEESFHVDSRIQVSSLIRAFKCRCHPTKRDAALWFPQPTAIHSVHICLVAMHLDKLCIDDGSQSDAMTKPHFRSITSTIPHDFIDLFIFQDPLECCQRLGIGDDI